MPTVSIQRSPARRDVTRARHAADPSCGTPPPQSSGSGPAHALSAGECTSPRRGSGVTVAQAAAPIEGMHMPQTGPNETQAVPTGQQANALAGAV